MIPYDIIATGSGGNALILDNRVMIDCGVSWAKIKSKIDHLQVVLLTHEHGDHFCRSTVRHLAKERPSLRWAAGDWMALELVESGVRSAQIDLIPDRPDFLPVLNYDDIILATPVRLSHDVPNLGWKICMDTVKEVGIRIFYATDTGNLDGIRAENYDLYFLEANYGEQEIEERIGQKKLDGEFVYENRVKRTHLSKEQADDWIANNAGPNSVYIYMHNHKEKQSHEQVSREED